MADIVDRISPLATLAVPGVYGADAVDPGVEISERLPDALVQVGAWPNTLGNVTKAIEKVMKIKLADGNNVTSGSEFAIMPTGPGRWLIESEDEYLADALNKVVPAKQGNIVSLTHGRVVVRVSGEKAVWLLATGLALDFHLSAFSVGEVRLSHHHEIGVTVHRTGEDTFDLYVFTSLARGFWRWLITAAGEVGYRVT